MDTVAKREYDKYVEGMRISKDMLETATQKAENKGKVEGKAEGKVEGKVEVVLFSYDDKLPLPQIARITQLSEDEVIKILKDHGKI